MWEWMGDSGGGECMRGEGRVSEEDFQVLQIFTEMICINREEGSKGSRDAWKRMRRVGGVRGRGEKEERRRR